MQSKYDIFNQVKTKSKLIENRLREFEDECSLIRDISGKGFLWSIHFSDSIDGNLINQHITEKLCALGVLPSLYQSRKAQFLEFAPPLVTTEAELNDVLDKYHLVFKNLTTNSLPIGQQDNRIYEADI